MKGLSLDGFFDGRSMPRNRELMRVFRDVGLVEHLGSGVHRILKKYDRSVFKISENFVEIRFPFEEAYNAAGGSDNGGPIELTERQKEVLLLIQKNTKLTKRALAEKLSINVSAAQAHIKALKEKGIIVREGGTRGYWKITI